MDTQSNRYITGDPAFAVDSSGVVVLWNEAAEKSFGIAKPDALGKKCWKLLDGEDDFGNRYCCRHCPIREMGFRHEPIHSFHSTFTTADNKQEHFAVSCVTVFDEPGNEILLHICHPESEPANALSYPPAEISNPLSPLSGRELEVLKMLADGVRTKDIATKLAISIRTVRTHIQHVMYKLQVHKRIEAIKVGKRLKLI